MTEINDPATRAGTDALRSLSTLRARRLGIETQDETVVFMPKECHVCRSEGFSARVRIRVRRAGRSIIATLYQVTSGVVKAGEIGLSESAWRLLDVADGEDVEISHPAPVESLGSVRGKIYGKRLGARAFHEIIGDIVAGRYSDVELASFVTACSALDLDHHERIALTRAMVEAGDRLEWPVARVMDKHSVGGLPGNRTTPIVVAIVTACGLTMPKTSSRAITSPAGTADAMEALAPVDLDLAAMRRVVEQEGGCIVWGGAVRLSPADDLLIRVERALDLDSEGQLVASVLSKKAAAGASDLVLDLPVGPTAKVRSAAAAKALAESLVEVARSLGIAAKVLMSDGTQPVGKGIGPALEARDVLAVLCGELGAPSDLRSRAVTLAGALLEVGGVAQAEQGPAAAMAALADGRAWQKFQAICEAQGGMRQPPRADHLRPVVAKSTGCIAEIDNRRIAKVAKLAGAPSSKPAGVELHTRVGDSVAEGAPLYTIHAATRGELAYAVEYAGSNPDIFQVEDA